MILPLFYEYSRKWLGKPKEKNLDTDTLKTIDFLRESRKIGYSHSLNIPYSHVCYTSASGQERRDAEFLNCCKAPVIIAAALPLLLALTMPHQLPGYRMCGYIAHCTLHRTAYPRGRLASKWMQRLISDMQTHECLFVAI